MYIKEYYRLIKPGIVYGNAMTALAAFVFVSERQVDVVLLIAMLVGISFTIAASCVVNNVLDRDIDAHMERTKDRALPTGRVSVRNALLFALALGLIGFIALLDTNPLALGVTLFGVVVYVGIYTPLKRWSRHSTIVGALAGAVPPVVGYVAVKPVLDSTAIMLFLVLICWQMIHFLAIAIFRRSEYHAAELPVMSVRFSITRTKVVMAIYTFLFAYALFALWSIAGLGLLFAIPLGLLSLGWILLAALGFRMKDAEKWARKMFFYSILVLLTFCIALSFS